MVDFATISITEQVVKKELVVLIGPKFHINLRTKDLMVKGGDFYAVWNEKLGLWCKSEQAVIDILDEATIETYKSMKGDGRNYRLLLMKDADSGMIDRFHKLVQKQMRDVFVPLDEKVIFQNTPVKKSDYVSKRLPYAIEEGSLDAYEELISTLYDPDERAKLEWAIGAIISGDAKHIQKFEVLYGDKGTGKGTVLDIIIDLFGGIKDGYVSTFNAKDLGNANSSFALESFKDNPLVSVQTDGNLSRIEDNTKLNSIVSHEVMEVNAKYTKLYQARFNTFLFMGTNHPVKITDAKSGILRRLIDVSPSGRKIPYRKYHQLKKQVKFELGAIAYHCLQVYNEMGEDYYEDYIPLSMMAATNDFYDFLEYNMDEYVKRDFITLSEAWGAYKEYCEYAHAYQIPYRIFKTELANYFDSFEDRALIDGKRLRSVYYGFKKEKFEKPVKKKKETDDISWLKFKEQDSSFDKIFSEYLAQGCKEDGSPKNVWSKVNTKLKDIDTKTLHWVKPDAGSNLVMMDFDKRNKDGVKDFELNKKAASKFAKTYAELSKSGGGIHLYYFYTGDVSKLSHVVEEGVELKTFTGNSSIRRLLSKCNDLDISTISSGLPLKGDDKKMVNWDGIRNEKQLRTMILKNIRKEYHPDTSSSIDYIKHLLDEAYESGISYDVSDMFQAVLLFAMNSTNQSERCVNVVSEMHFASDETEESVVVDDSEYADDRLIFFDCEIGRPDEATNNPGIFLICWKYRGDSSCVRMINPKPSDVEWLFHRKIIGFNNLYYDNPMLYAASIGYSNLKLFDLSTSMIVYKQRPSFANQARNISYTDVFDFTTEKMGLKKWEIKLGHPHKEMNIPWNMPIPVDRWEDLCKYCENDVKATEAVFEARQEDFMARQFQVAIVGILHPDIKVTVNDTTNTLSKRFIFGKDKTPQGEFNYRDLSKPVGSDRYEEYLVLFGDDYRFRVFNAEGLPEYRDYIPGEVLPDGWSILPFFPGYTFDEFAPKGKKSVYLDENIGEGGRVYSVTGMYKNVWDGDISSQHPHSIIAEVLFGARYTKIFSDIVKARVAIKHHDFETAGMLLGGALKPYLSDEYASGLAQALKIVINSIYGLTKAGFDNEFRDARNVDNIVAKRGALFMTLLKREVERLGYLVCHIKTDSIKIPEADERIKDFVIKFGREYGYEFETEAVFEKFCLLNDAAYAGKTDSGKWITKANLSKDASPYVFKTIFSKEPTVFRDFCETFSVTQGELYLDLNEDLEDVSSFEKDLSKYESKMKGLVRKGELINWDPDQDEYVLELRLEIAAGHNYEFIGRVGLFSPVVDGVGGGYLYRCKDGKYYAVGGTSGYRWLESDYILEHGLEDKVDLSYYVNQVNEVIDDISALGDYNWLVSDSDVPKDFMNPPEVEEEGDFKWQ